MQPSRLTALLLALCEGEYNARELADMASLHYNTTIAYLRALHEAHLIYICKWEKDRLGRASVPIFALVLVRNQSVPREKVSRAEQQRRYRKRRTLRAEVTRTAELLEVGQQQARPRVVRTPRTASTATVISAAPALSSGWQSLWINDDV